MQCIPFCARFVLSERGCRVNAEKHKRMMNEELRVKSEEWKKVSKVAKVTKEAKVSTIPV